MPNLQVIPYNDINALKVRKIASFIFFSLFVVLPFLLKTVLAEIGPRVAGFLVEPIQGEAG
jgi:acetylornithine/succinyldiaminopimelate/putrescine aminotransferase